MRRSFAAIAIASFLVTTGTAGAATTIGATPTPGLGANCIADSTWLQVRSPQLQYAAPFSGVITSWSHLAAGSPPQLKLKVARLVSGSDYTVIGESTAHTPAVNTLSTYPTRIPVQAGDLIGLTSLTLGECGANVADYDYAFKGSDTPVGNTTTFLYQPDFQPDFQLDISAQLEADADGDGFGDESQDQCSTDSSTQGPCQLPSTPAQIPAAPPVPRPRAARLRTPG